MSKNNQFKPMMKTKCKVQEKQNRAFKHSAVSTSNANLSNGLWDSLHFQELCEVVTEWKCSSLNLANNKTEQIVKQISPICFPSLQVLVLSKNFINSIEGLIYLDLHMLERLDLSNNKISSFRIVRKMNWPRILALNFESNACAENIALCQTHLPGVDEISLDYYFFERPISQDIAHLVKLNAQGPNNIWVDSSARIRQKAALSAIKRKYSRLEIGESHLDWERVQPGRTQTNQSDRMHESESVKYQ